MRMRMRMRACVQVNAAVQESLMDAAVAADADALGFNDFVQLMRVGSADSLASSELSVDLYDPRVGAGGFTSMSTSPGMRAGHGLSGSGMVGSGGGEAGFEGAAGAWYAPALEAIPDQDVADGEA